MSDKNKRDRIISKVKKLLAMAGDSSSPEEALIAARQARALMDKYQIEKSEIEIADKKFGVAKESSSWKRLPLWKQWLSISIAEWNDCITKSSYETETDSWRIAFKGFNADAIIAASMYDYLTKSIERLLKSRGIKGRGSIYQYKIAASYALCERIDLLTNERKQEVFTSDGKSLVLVKMDMVHSHFGEPHYEEGKPVRDPTKEESEAALLGSLDGNKINLDPQIGAKNNQKKLA